MSDLSSTITAGGVAQPLALFNPARHGLIIQVPSGNGESVFVRFGGTATAVPPSIEVAPGDTLVMGTEFRELICRPISIYGATTSKAFTAFDSLV
jgi:hypothetical protein